MCGRREVTSYRILTSQIICCLLNVESRRWISNAFHPRCSLALQEHDRIGHYLDIQTKKPLISKLDAQLLEASLDFRRLWMAYILLTHDTGTCTDNCRQRFWNLNDTTSVHLLCEGWNVGNDMSPIRIKDLERLYNLLLRVNGLSNIRVRISKDGPNTTWRPFSKPSQPTLRRLE